MAAAATLTVELRFDFSRFEIAMWRIRYLLDPGGTLTNPNPFPHIRLFTRRQEGMNTDGR